MAGLTDEEVNKIADALALRVEKSNKQFWIDPEKHYISHNELDQMVSDYRSAKGIFWKLFIALVAGGAIIMAAFGLFVGKFK